LYFLPEFRFTLIILVMDNTTLVLGASPNPERYSYRAVKTLQRKNIPVIAVGRREFSSDGLTIRKGMPEDTGPVDTVTLYLNAKNQEEYYEYILALKPRRVIFNPGASNEKFEEICRINDIEVVTDCMLAMLACGQF
jgi:predicted CoA-binding protein